MMEFWRRFRRNRGAVIGLAVLLLIAGVAMVASVLFPASPWQIAGRPFSEPLALSGLPLGTDMLGRDIAAGLAHGARVSLSVGVAATAAACGIGITIGALAGYFGGFVDDWLMRFTEFFQILPIIVIAVVLVAILSPSIYSVIAAIAITSWPPIARLVRGEFLSLRSREFVQAARLVGLSHVAIIARHVLPNALSPIIVAASLMVATSILIESGLSFFGLGDPERMSWGFMIGAARAYVRDGWWMSFFPGLAIFFTVLAINLVGEGLNDALNPRLARKGRA